MWLNSSAWGWPQFAISAMLLIALIVAFVNHEKPSKHNFPLVVTRALVWVFVLACGGFFK